MKHGVATEMPPAYPDVKEHACLVQTQHSSSVLYLCIVFSDI